MTLKSRRTWALILAVIVGLALVASTSAAGAQGGGRGTGDDAAEVSSELPEGQRCPDGEIDVRPGAAQPRCRGENRCPGGDVDATPRAPEPTCEPPRCAGSVDLTPDAPVATCIAQQQLGSLLSEFEAAAAEEVLALGELSEVLTELEALDAALAEMLLRLGEVQLRLAGAGADARFAAIRHDVAVEGLADVSEVLADEEERLRTSAVEAYIGGGEVELEVESALSGIENDNDAEIAREYASVVMDDQLETVDTVEALRNAVARLEEIVADVEQSAEADQVRVGAIEAQAARLTQRQRELVQATEAEAGELTVRIAEIQAEKESYANELAITGVSGGSVGDTLRVTQAGQRPPERISGLLVAPLDDIDIGSLFGPRVHPIFGGTRLHAGIDLSGPSGTPIHAAADGLVVMSETIGGYGNAVVLDHGNTVGTLYAHMTAQAVSVGDEVVQGDVIGFVGSTGYSTGPHLHFEARILGQPVDPMPYLDFTP